MTRLLLPLLLLATHCGLYAQPSWTLPENTNWKFYQYGGIRFEDNQPLSDSSSMRFLYEGTSSGIYTYSSATVSDRQGNLLFYTDAYNVWDRNHQPMPNGNNLLPSNALDATLIVPDPGSGSQYYIFYLSGTNDFGGFSTNAYQLRYSKVDMGLNDGLGDVVSGQKNILVEDNLSSQLKAVAGDDCNIWLITHALDSARFKAFELNAEGVNTTPVVSNTGNGYVGFMGPLSFSGHLATTHDRSRLAYVQYGGDLVPIVELFNFDPATATVSNAQVIDTLNFINFSLCFSPDNSKLYLTMNKPDVSDWLIASSLYQYDVNAGTPTAIMNSKVLISDSISSVNACMRIGPDGKIYIPAAFGNDTSMAADNYFYDLSVTPDTYPGAPNYPFSAYLGCIQNPNSSGVASNFERHAVALSPYSSAAEALGGEFVRPIPGDSLITENQVALCPATDVAQLEADANSFFYEWDNGDTTPERAVSSPGTYWVHHGDYCHFQVDTFVVTLEAMNAHITVDGFVLGTSESYATYQWLFNGELIAGADNSTYTVTENGDYTVIVGSESGCTDTSDIYTVTNVGIASVHPLAASIRVFPNPSNDVVFINAPVAVNMVLTSIEGRVLQTVNSASSISLKTFASGIYLLKVLDKDGAVIKAGKILKR